MLDAEIRCMECGIPTYPRGNGLHLCDKCYEEFFFGISPQPKNDDPDFEVKHEVAQIKPKEDVTFVADGRLSVFGAVNLKMPKRVVFNPDCRVKDYEKLIVFLLENMYIYDNAKGFEKVRYMFKEIDE